jgi:DNA-binding response OmpR family regulator
MSKSKILIVEDNGIISLQIMQILQSKGYPSYAVFSSEYAVKKAQEIKPDLVLMDIKLNGEVDCIKTAIKINEMMDVPIVYLTSCADEATLNAVKSTKSCVYILKPFDGDELVNAVEMALNKHKYC